MKKDGGKSDKGQSVRTAVQALRTCASSPSAAPVWVSDERFVGAVLFIFQVSALDLFWDGGNSEWRRWGASGSAESGDGTICCSSRRPQGSNQICSIDTCAVEHGLDWGKLGTSSRAHSHTVPLVQDHVVVVEGGVVLPDRIEGVR